MDKKLDILDQSMKPAFAPKGVPGVAFPMAFGQAECRGQGAF
jgi:hypothetical protein